MISPERLRRFPHCAAAPDEFIRKVAMLGESREFKKGEELFREGNSATHLMFLEKGEIDIVYHFGDSRQVVVDTLVPGETLSWSALLEPHKLTATGVARKDGRAIQIDGQELKKLCQENPEYGYRMMIEIAKVLRSRLAATRVQLAAKG